ncbi:hypothetical protein Y032_0286g1381 [Ancylostoma ceylanicum]|uniref:Uncharacterized protein n=1 Tax=Ancylostoma ceylanicum TaxID=53326 RepID=A0A016S5V9_9BILA|nr:hypothetical protein Y032_0286g1381 [Ancylostoma ceylanicum]
MFVLLLLDLYKCHINHSAIFIAIASASLLDGSMETGTALQPNNFSSIARRLLLNREPLQVPQLPSTSYEVHRPVTHVDEVCAV